MPYAILCAYLCDNRTSYNTISSRQWQFFENHSRSSPCSKKLDREIIQQVKKYAQRKNMSLSKMVEKYLKSLTIRSAFFSLHSSRKIL
ncbi:MAG: DUF6364 family protein [bacterium]